MNYNFEEAKCVREGLDSEMELIKFHDQYVCCYMPIEFKDYIGPSQDKPVKILPMKRRIRDILSLNVSGQRVERMDLIVCLQRHNCKMGRCLKEWKEHKICCRFKFREIFQIRVFVIVGVK